MKNTKLNIYVLPGLDGTGTMLKSFIETLRTKYSVQLITYPTNIYLSYAKLAELVSEQLPKNSPYIIIAESFSGPIAVKIAAKKPKELRAIIFAASFAKKPNSFPKFFSFLTSILPLKTPSLYKLARTFTFGRWASAKLDKDLEAAIEPVSSKVLAYRIKEVLNIDELHLFENIRTPMLYLQPSQDRLVSKASVRELILRKERLEVQVLEGPHFILQTNPKESVRKIDDFIRTRT